MGAAEISAFSGSRNTKNDSGRGTIFTCGRRPAGLLATLVVVVVVVVVVVGRE